MTNEELTIKVEELENKIKTMEASGTFPFSVGEAIRERLGLTENVISFTSSDSSPSVQAVNESGSATYDVAAPMVGFVYITLPNGNTYKLARY